MSVYITFDEGPGEQVASNSGWGDFRNWSRTLDVMKYQAIHKLVVLGYSHKPGVLANLLGEAVKENPPQALGVDIIIQKLRTELLKHDTEEAVFVTDGMGRG